MKKIIIRVSIVLLIILGIVAGTATIIHLKNNQNKILKIQTASTGFSIKSPWSWKHPKYFTISVNGRITKILPTQSFKKVKNQIIDINNNTFDSYDDEKNDEARLKIIKYPKLKDQYGKTVHDKNYKKMMKQMIKYIHSDILAVRFFKTKKYYYVSFEINQFISDETDLYRFNPRNNQFKKMCALNNVDVVKIQELK